MTPSRFSGQDMSLAELRTLPDIGVERVYVTDLGKQGWFEIDPMDTNFTNRLSFDSGTIINAINNCFKFSISNITTVTNSVNNNVLT